MAHSCQDLGVCQGTVGSDLWDAKVAPQSLLHHMNPQLLPEGLPSHAAMFQTGYTGSCASALWPRTAQDTAKSLESTSHTCHGSHSLNEHRIASDDWAASPNLVRLVACSWTCTGHQHISDMVLSTKAASPPFPCAGHTRPQRMNDNHQDGLLEQLRSGMARRNDFSRSRCATSLFN